jgi:hypothetical protein
LVLICLCEKKTSTEQFCQDILTLNIAQRKAFANLVMALASFTSAKSVVALSESPVFQFQYSTICDVVSNFAKTSRELKEKRRTLQALFLARFGQRRVYDFQTDGVSIFREHSPCLANRRHCYKANQVVKGQKPIGIGYRYSFVNVADVESGWSLPFEIEKLDVEKNAATMAAEQIIGICRRKEFENGLNINCCDSEYGQAKYLSPTSPVKNLVSVVRLRHGRKVYPEERRADTGGAPQVYGEAVYLIEKSRTKSYRREEKIYEKYQASVKEKEPLESLEIRRETSRGKKLLIKLRRWDGYLMRSKDGHDMKETVFDLVGSEVLEEETGKRVFKHDQFVAVVGEERAVLSLEQVYEKYRHRFDHEQTNRFGKQNLFWESYQTPKEQNQDNWLTITQMAMWLLYEASPEVESGAKKWQKYSEPKIEKGGRKTASQTRKGLEGLILSFEKKVFEAKKCKKGSGRRKSEKQEPRKQYEVVKKGEPLREKRKKWKASEQKE